MTAGARKPTASPVSSTDPYFDLVVKHWAKIRSLYQQFRDKRPIMLYDVQDQQILAYPYEDFKADLSQRSQDLLDEQYREAKVENSIVVFVRDNVKKKLVSYCLA